MQVSSHTVWANALERLDWDFDQPNDHPDTDYVALRAVGGPGWGLSTGDGSCTVTGERRNGRKSFRDFVNQNWSSSPEDTHCIGKSAASALWDFMPEPCNIQFGNAGFADDIKPEYGYCEVNQVMRDDGGSTTERGKVAARRLLELVAKCGSVGAATLPNGMDVVVEADGSSDGNNSVLNVATATWYFCFEQNYYG
jgi:hypothetical protein